MKRPRRIIHLFVYASFILTSCENKLSREAYIKWVHDYRNGLHVKKTFSSFVFDLQYQPSDYISLIHNNSASGNASEHDQAFMEYFTLNVSVLNSNENIVGYQAESQEHLQRRKYYFSYLFQNDLYLEENGKRVPCVLFHFEQPNLQNKGTFVVAFTRTSKDTPSGDTNFVIDSPYISSLPIKIKVSKENIPSLKI